MTVDRAERLRAAMLFALLGAVPVFLAGWLLVLQVAHAGSLAVAAGKVPLRLGPAAADAQALARERMPAPRGTVVDRHGATLAIDCEVYEVRAEVQPPARKRADASALRSWLDQLTADLAECLLRKAPPEQRADLRQRCRDNIGARLAHAFDLEHLPASGSLAKDQVPRSANILVDGDVDSLAVIEQLRQLDAERDALGLQWQRSHRRVYPDRDYTWGVVGFEESLPVQSAQQQSPSGYQRVGTFGLEAKQVLQAGAGGERVFQRDASGNGYWTGPPRPAEPPAVMQSTLDLELQKAACRELDAEARTPAAEGANKFAQWGALVLLEVASGDVLAIASYQRDAPNARSAAVAPYQNRYEPGSIVKPLMFAWALQYGGLDWNEEFDCHSAGEHHERTIDGRTIHDDHACATLTPHGIIVNSSNIGAVLVGKCLSRPQWHDYLRFYQFGMPEHRNGDKVFGTPVLGLRLEAVGSVARQIFAKMSDAGFSRNSGISLSFGYELQVTAVQMARAYLSLLSGRQRQLRICRGVELDGVQQDAPPGAQGPQVLGPAVLEAVMAAMLDVVSADEHATGRTVQARFLKEEGLDLHGLIAGKTGTSVSHTTTGAGADRVRVEVRNASFVGYVPADAPRYLAVCVLQKEGSARYYGGHYAAPPVVRLLLQAMALEQRQRSGQGPQVSASPGRSGWSGVAPEKSQAGR